MKMLSKSTRTTCSQMTMQRTSIPMAMDCQTNLTANRRPRLRLSWTWTTTTTVSSTRWKPPVVQIRSTQPLFLRIWTATSNATSTTSILMATPCSTMPMPSHETPAHPPTPMVTVCPIRSLVNQPSPKISTTTTTAGRISTKQHVAVTHLLQASCRSMKMAMASATQCPRTTMATPTPMMKKHNVDLTRSMQQAFLPTSTTTQSVTLSTMTWMVTELQTLRTCTRVTQASTKMSLAAPTPHHSTSMLMQTSMTEHA